MTKEKKKEDAKKDNTLQETENGCELTDSEIQDPSIADLNINSEIENTSQELQKKVDGLTKEKEEYLLLVQRVQADFDNYRRRNNMAVADAYNNGIQECVQLFLPVLDNLQRAIESAQEDTNVNSLLAGVEKVLKQYSDILTKIGVEEITALHKTFNPELHNAVVKVDVQNEEEVGLVVEVFQKGYKLKDKVLRYSMVKVAN